MGQPKLLLPWRDTTVLGWIIRQWQQLSAAQIAVVCRDDDSALHAELDRLQLARAHRIINPDPARGMFSSIQCAARWDGWSRALTHLAIALGDQPNLSIQTFTALADAARDSAAPIVQPSYDGRAAHPVILHRSSFDELKTTHALTLKEFLAHQRNVRLVPVDDPGVTLDMNTPEDYRAIHNRSGT